EVLLALADRIRRLPVVHEELDQVAAAAFWRGRDDQAVIDARLGRPRLAPEQDHQVLWRIDLDRELARRPQQLVDRSNPHEPAVVDDGHARADLLNLREDVAGDEDRLALRREAAQQVA